jgi:DNA-binding NarL/FixJ family response regulator
VLALWGKGLAMKILIVEQHAESVAALNRYLIRLRHRVRRVPTPDAARQECARERVDLMICDVGLSPAPWVALLQELKGKCGLRGIATSGHGEQQDVRAAIAANFDAYLLKPYALGQLDEAMKHVAKG